MPRKLIILGVILLLGSWFLLGDRKTAWEKLLFLFTIVFVYMAWRLLIGDTFPEIIAPLLAQ